MDKVSAQSPRSSSPRRAHGRSSESKSIPSTPFQRPESLPEERTSPTPDPATKKDSPASQPSDKSHTPPISRRPYAGCKYETGMARARRRVPYSLGPEPLEKQKSELKTRLTRDEDDRLTSDMRALFDTLQPDAESEARRAKLVAKFEKILRTRWPTSAITVNVFGSTGNNLGTVDSDVDLCITTDCKEMERVCCIAELLASHGMERVVCVSSAKVPIVKVWDPEWQVACDINVNNPLALENTELVKHYVEIDPRVRPLAMIIKYWAKRRILNDAALGGTLSSYTWICLTLNFLQTRDPPILPTLQGQPALPPKYLAGVNVAFDHDVASFAEFGARNRSSLGELLFHFFRYYGHELDFEQNVLSVRLGRALPKAEKSWHRLQDNRLCVEEPFNVSRNLANTADNTSMRGIHLELRRAFDLIGEGKLAKCCEEFVYPAEEIKLSEHFVPPAARPVVPQPPTQPTRGGRHTTRGGRNQNGVNRPLNGRRSSNPTGRNYLRNLPFPMTTQELQLQAQHQQHLLHDQLFQQYQYLQLQEQELRMQLHQQNLRQRGLLASYQQSAGYFHGPAPDDLVDQHAPAGSVVGINRAPQSAPLYQHRFPQSSPYLPSAHLSQGVATNPPSPRLHSVAAETLRYSRRTSLAHSATGPSLRAQSQPARPLPLSNFGQLHAVFGAPTAPAVSAGRRSSTSSGSQEQFPALLEGSLGMSTPMTDTFKPPGEYLGYYVGQSPSLSAYPPSVAISPMPPHVGLAIQHGGLSPQLPSSSARPAGAVQTPPLPAMSSVTNENRGPFGAAPVTPMNATGLSDPAPHRAGPLVVDGSIKSPQRDRSTQEVSELDDAPNFSGSTSEDLACDTPSSSDEQSQDALDAVSVVTKEDPEGALGVAHLGFVPSPPADEHLPGPIPLRPFHGGPNGDIRKRNPVMAERNGIPHMGTTQKPTPAWPHDRKLSSVEEVRDTSSRPNTRSDVTDSAEAGALDRSPRTATGDGLPDNIADGLRVKPLSPRTNASPVMGDPMAHGAKILPETNGWQLHAKKKKAKKPTRSEAGSPPLNGAGGEILPADGALRKGG